MNAPFLILVASNDTAVRAAAAHHFSSKRLACRCVDFDEKLVSEVTRHPPVVLVGELSLRSRYFSASDTDAAFNFLMAVKLRFPGMPILTLHAGDDPEVTAISKRMKFQGHFAGPVYDYAGIRAAVQTLIEQKLARVARARARRKPLGGDAVRAEEDLSAMTEGLSIALAHQRAKVFKFNMELSNNELWRMQKKENRE